MESLLQIIRVEKREQDPDYCKPSGRVNEVGSL
jgi:hypothetical protein